MSSFRKTAKSLKRTHRERGQVSARCSCDGNYPSFVSQPASRKHLGLLEKHKDYALRARCSVILCSQYSPYCVCTQRLWQEEKIPENFARKGEFGANAYWHLQFFFGVDVLTSKARNKNPDEFYYRMISEKLKVGTIL